MSSKNDVYSVEHDELPHLQVPMKHGTSPRPAQLIHTDATAHALHYNQQCERRRGLLKKTQRLCYLGVVPAGLFYAGPVLELPLIWQGD
ncbi:hypothetical protein NOF04DRAFT_11444 [Fusarium oxysporum II5]|uniref:Uncharacterized protein n=2 Tax=Fusarium oxysporum species complex TaxID=171631 RepID=X0KBY5_FUSO5|nr:uncharacterized protein FOIG_12673 [Fusarium odoratissimum NRRL 54006]EXL94479.1 hypothetical protein FOIG_12673 [Fusarium odoratissimum NRRL 54006]KAK2122435.1 hypothetical protein NOF04DRAFT_11444 [Fusarium oxysporum II5]TXB96550.1 hypothetical protein FocTR4_00010983 [Fusarium oxysporum f. sp. cubense]